MGTWESGGNLHDQMHWEWVQEASESWRFKAKFRLPVCGEMVGGSTNHVAGSCGSDWQVASAGRI